MAGVVREEDVETLTELRHQNLSLDQFFFRKLLVIFGVVLGVVIVAVALLGTVEANPKVGRGEPVLDIFANATVVKMTRLSTKPIISREDSDFYYNYNCAYLPLFEKGNHNPRDCLAVRVQDLRPNHTSIFQVTASSIVLVCSIDGSLTKFERVSRDRVILAPEVEGEDELGVEDPRVVFDKEDGTYYMFYTAVARIPGPGGETSDPGSRVIARLALATTKTPRNAASWVKHGPIFPLHLPSLGFPHAQDEGWSKSGALLRASAGTKHGLLLWGDHYISLAVTDDLLHYNATGQILLQTRDESFDSMLVESGPEPLRLSNGNYLFLYNSARPGYPSEKPGWDIQYNFGWVVLDKEDPSRVVERASAPLFSPELPWETCDTAATLELTPNVVFVEGWKQTGENEFVVWYQGCDANIGVASVHVHFHHNE